MAGGIWLSQNKTRPGAYINFTSVPKSSMTTGDRGIVALPVELDWGAEDKLIEVLSTDLLTGDSKKAIGVTATDSGAKLLAGALSYCYKALVYRANYGGSKASAIIGGCLVTAKYNGTFGNKIIVAVERDGSGIFEVITYVDGEVVDTQKVTTLTELEANDYVVFSQREIIQQTDEEGNIIPQETDLVETAGTALEGGSNGILDESASYPKFMKLLRMAKWQTMACLSSNDTIKRSVVNFIKAERDDYGRYVQGVVADYDGADAEGIINSVSGVIIDGVTFSKEEFTCIVAGMTAGANFNQSNTARVVTGASEIIDEMTDEEIIKALKAGKFLISTSASGKIKVEQDINSLHTFTKKKDYTFSKNRVIRTLDEIGTTTKTTWEDTYMGKVDNNDTGRSVFKADLTSYAMELQRLNGITNFDVQDLSVYKGNDVDSVRVDWNVQPVDSMEKLYLQCNISG